MADYDLSRLNTRSFEQMIQALAVQVLGSDVVIFGDGPDGGREATFDGPIEYPSPDNGWNGYGVVQAKYRQRLTDTKQDGDWAVSQLKEELGKYLEPGNNLRRPEYFIYVTNVVLTPVNEKGSKDRVLSLLEKFKKRLSLKGYSVWDYDQIRGFLDNNQDVRCSYAAWVTPGDILAKVFEYFPSSKPDFQSTIRNFLQKELLNDQFANLGQAGHDLEDRIQLARVFVDLHTVPSHHVRQRRDLEDTIQQPYGIGSVASEARGFVEQILGVSAERLDPASLDSTPFGRPSEARPSPRTRGRYVLVGGPGQGKTTMGQFICQIFRTAILSPIPAPSLSPEVRHALSTIRAHCEEDGVTNSVVPRFPFRIVLNEFAAALSSPTTSQVGSILSYLAHLIPIEHDQGIKS